MANSLCGEDVCGENACCKILEAKMFMTNMLTMKIPDTLKNIAQR